jgi:hypothetical protein
MKRNVDMVASCLIGDLADASAGGNPCGGIPALRTMHIGQIRPSVLAGIDAQAPEQIHCFFHGQVPQAKCWNALYFATQYRKIAALNRAMNIPVCWPRTFSPC